MLLLGLGLTHVLDLYARPRPEPVPLWEGAPAVRDVRVLLASGAERIRLRADREVPVRDGQDRPLGSFSAAEWSIVQFDPTGGLRCGDELWDAGAVTLTAQAGHWVWVSIERSGQWSVGIACPGRLTVEPDGTGQRLRVTNALDLETYTACVVAGEVWPDFHREAYRVQAIAARTFAWYQMLRRASSPYDVTSTEAAQVYQGLRFDATGRAATLATRATRGVVCTYLAGDTPAVFPTYYSAACGGVTQSANVFGEAAPLPVLGGGVPCDYCSIAPGETYRWGAVSMPLADVEQRLCAREPDLERLRPLAAVEAATRDEAGRLLRIRLTATAGQTYEMDAERFRLALGARVVRSAFCDIQMDTGVVTFANGRGFGHGVGLCQWGMEGQARTGKRAGDILRYYYPGTILRRLY